MHEAGRQRIYADVVVRQLPGHDLAGHDDARLADRVNAVIHLGQEAVNGSDIDDAAAALLFHNLRHRLAEEI